MIAARCPRCEGAVALHEGHPTVTGGAIELWHPGCWELRGVPLAVEPAPAPPAPPAVARSPQRRAIAAVGASAAAAVGVASWAWAASYAAPAPAVVPPVEREPIAVRSAWAAPDDAPPAPSSADRRLEVRHPVPREDGEPLDERYPSLRGWIHPVTATKELFPDQASRHFGAERIGIMRAECGAGHCGVDLDGPRGRPIVAVAAGTLIRVEHSELGADGRSGRYVRIQHADGTLTAYMHMDEIADGLRVGSRVEAGQYVGTLGATAVYSAPPHLHFSLEIPSRSDARGDGIDTRFVDPAPFLVRATVEPLVDHRHAIKPAF